MSLTILSGALELGLIFAIMSLGIFISFKILNQADLTVDGSFVTGMAVSVVFAYEGHPILGLFLAMIAGGCAGAFTGVLQTIFKVSPILSGILTTTGLYSINLKIMGGKPNLSLFGKTTIFNQFNGVLSINQSELIIIITLCLFIVSSLYGLLKTQLGLSLIATGDNPNMVRSYSINSEAMRILGLALANGIVAFSGAIFGQYSSFSDITAGIGIMVIGVASIIVGETMIKSDRMFYRLLAVIIGAIIYRLILTVSMELGFNPNDLKLLSAVIVIVVISLPVIKQRCHKHKRKKNLAHVYK